MGRSPCCAKVGLKRGAWTAIEDKILTDYININGEGKWRKLPKRAGLKRCGKSCRLRWLNYLRPDIKRGNITPDEEDLINRLHKLLGNRWSLIAGRLPGRTDNEVKNYWNTKSKKVHVNETAIPIVTSPNIQAGAIRTKASKCAQVIVGSNPIKGAPPLHAPVKMTPPNFNSEENTTNFMMELELNSNFLSEFLKDDFLQLDEDGINVSSSSHYEQTLMFTDEMLDLDPMVPFTDWLENV